MQSINYAEWIAGQQMARGDTHNELRVQLLNTFGTPINLSGASVSFTASQNGRQVINKSDAQEYINGVVGFRLPDVPLKPGVLYIQITVHWPGNAAEKFPAGNDLFVKLS